MAPREKLVTIFNHLGTPTHRTHVANRGCQRGDLKLQTPLVGKTVHSTHTLTRMNNYTGNGSGEGGGGGAHVYGRMEDGGRESS